ncbi:Two component, sigma54 specific, transcriptional regulator, Fis family [Candidatus Zixiibacteriota bacterium]|nr:Two component, sigma54 specific, transcriptional regulator, Fis family [candidate division Zixibacteria bacterium]
MSQFIIDRSPATILLVDDDDTFRGTIEILLKSHGYNVITAEGVTGATRCIRERKLDLIITDLKMDDGTGIELLGKIKEAQAEIAVIIQTAYGSVQNAVEAMRQGAYDYITKPFKNEELLVLIEKALENKKIREELTVLREEIAWKYSFDNLVGISASLKQLKSLAARVASTDISILITGESGTGKELMAKAIHYHSNRRKKKFIPIDCTSIPANLMESEFFGHVKGSFTSAVANRKGLFEEADGGTVFLDEVGDMPLPLQAKILRVLQESEIRPVGSSLSKKIDVRILAATNRDLSALVEEGNFREDLFYRLNVLPITIPPLRERVDDIAVLAEHFLSLEKARRGEGNLSISADAMERLVQHRWPGNVRELENTIKRAIALSHDGRITGEDIMFITSEPAPGSQRNEILNGTFGTLEESLKDRIEATLHATNWNLSKTAGILGIGRTTLWRKVKKYNIDRNEKVLLNQK